MKLYTEEHARMDREIAEAKQLVKGAEGKERAKETEEEGAERKERAKETEEEGAEGKEQVKEGKSSGEGTATLEEKQKPAATGGQDEGRQCSAL